MDYQATFQQSHLSIESSALQDLIIQQHQDSSSNTDEASPSPPPQHSQGKASMQSYQKKQGTVVQLLKVFNPQFQTQVKASPGVAIECHGIDMGQFFGQTVVKTPISSSQGNNRSNKKQMVITKHKQQPNKLEMKQSVQRQNLDLGNSRYEINLNKDKEDQSFQICRVNANLKLLGDGLLNTFTSDQTPQIYETSRPLTTQGARSTTSFNPSFEHTRNLMYNHHQKNLCYYTSHSRPKQPQTNFPVYDNNSPAKQNNINNFDGTINLTLPLENLTLKNSVNAPAVSSSSTSHHLHPITGALRPDSAFRSNKRLMMNYGIMLKNRHEYNSYKIQGDHHHQINNKRQIISKNQQQQLQLQQQQMSRDIKNNHESILSTGCNKGQKGRSLSPNDKLQNRNTQMTHILLSDLLKKTVALHHAPNNLNNDKQKTERIEKVKQLSRGGGGFSLTQHKQASKSQKKGSTSKLNSQNHTFSGATQNTIIQVQHPLKFRDDNPKRRYEDQAIDALDERSLELARLDIEDENVYMDATPAVYCKKEEPRLSSIEVGGQGLPHTVYAEENVKSAKDMSFMVTVMGRQKISSKQYKNGLKSQKNQSMSDISILNQSDNISQNPLMGQQRLTSNGDKSSTKDLNPYNSKEVNLDFKQMGIDQFPNRPQTALNLKVLQTSRNAYSNSTAQIKTGRPQSRNQTLRLLKQSRNVLSNNVIDLNSNLNNEASLIIQPISCDMFNHDFNSGSVSQAKGSRPKTAISTNINGMVSRNNQESMYRKSLYNNFAAHYALRDQKTQLSKSFRALSRGANNSRIQQTKGNNEIIGQTSLKNQFYRPNTDCPQFFTKQLKLEESSPIQRKIQLVAAKSKSPYQLSNPLNKKPYHLNSYLTQGQNLMQGALQAQPQSTLEHDDPNPEFHRSSSLELQQRGFMSVVIPNVQDNEIMDENYKVVRNLKIDGIGLITTGKVSAQENTKHITSVNHNTIEQEGQLDAQEVI